MKASPALIGPAAAALAAARSLAAKRDRVAILLDGDPGIGKTAALDQLAREIGGDPFAIEHVNGQSLSVDLVRQWRERAHYGNLFSDWTVKRVDEIDSASSSAIAELLTFLDYLPARIAILATTNEYAKLRAQSKGRLETRFHRFQVEAPSFEETTDHLAKAFKIPKGIAQQIARGAVPDGHLLSAGCNMRAAIKDAESYLAAIADRKEAA
ncbi:AAA family ATPase [Prosthecobacter sp.]|uniref:AAA family ATPase n=1 Tax=Prosthecobacter sp. TaxID=1965333 RepID=UPI0037841307